ncbi:MAG: CBS domain-containing protein [Candidatus Omnitrophica bacterium]|nr:CBS domain-containing protein [Candidatus Omnitrophota bacterium]
MKIREIMATNVVSIKPDDNVLDALIILLKREISGLPVMDAQGKLVGMFTEKDIISAILPSYIKKVGKFIYEENPKSTKKKFSEFSAMKVSQLMRHEVIATSEETTLCEAARIMLTQNIRRLPIVDKAGTVVGMIARGDVLSAFAKEAEVLFP